MDGAWRKPSATPSCLKPASTERLAAARRAITFTADTIAGTSEPTVTDQFIRTEDRLLEGMANTARGQRRDAFYALWLFVRQCDGHLAPRALSPDANRKRLEGLERRLSSLTLPAPLRRGMTGGLGQLREHEPDIALALHQLVAPTKDTLGAEAADAIDAAAQKVRALDSTLATSA